MTTLHVPNLKRDPQVRAVFCLAALRRRESSRPGRSRAEGLRSMIDASSCAAASRGTMESSRAFHPTKPSHHRLTFDLSSSLFFSSLLQKPFPQGIPCRQIPSSRHSRHAARLKARSTTDPWPMDERSRRAPSHVSRHSSLARVFLPCEIDVAIRRRWLTGSPQAGRPAQCLMVCPAELSPRPARVSCRGASLSLPPG